MQHDNDSVNLNELIVDLSAAEVQPAADPIGPSRGLAFAASGLLSKVHREPMTRATTPAWDRDAEPSPPEFGAVGWDRGAAIDRKEIINVLNELVETAHDCEYAFFASASELASPSLSLALSTHAKQRGSAAHHLGELVRRLGGTPAQGGTAGGVLQRGWIRVKGTFHVNSEKSILDECERCEDAAATRYREALEIELPDDVREVVAWQAHLAQTSRDHVIKLRSELRGST